MIQFHCKNCGQKFSVPQTGAGKKGRCPKCKNIVVAPEVDGTNLIKLQADTSEISPKDSVLNPNLFDIPQKSRQSDVSDKALENLRKLKSGEVEPAPERKLPWLIDIFLYPANFQGVIFLAIAVLVPLMLQLASMFLCVFGLLFSLLNAVIGMYVYWFLAQCVRDSALGGLRAD